MLWLGFCALSLAVSLGAGMLAGRWRKAALLHGGAGLTGLLALAAAFRFGAFAGRFAWLVIVMTALAFAGGTTLYTLARQRRPRPGLLIFLHAMFGGLATLLLAGFVFGR